jgi:hypothetical protein
MSTLLARALFALCCCAPLAALADPAVTAQGRCLWEDKADDLAKKVGYKAIWDTAKTSKAPDFPSFLKALGKPWTNPHQ